MRNEKISISLDEVNSPKIDIKIRQEDFINRAQQHYQQVATAPAASQHSGFFRKAFVYMTLFGLIGGLLAWGAGEIIRYVGESNHEQYLRLSHAEKEIDFSLEQHSISQQNADLQKDAIHRELALNPYAKLLQDLDSHSASETEFQSRLTELKNHDWWVEHIAESAFWALVAMILAVFLAIAEPIVGRNVRGFFFNGFIGALIGFFGGFFVSLFINLLYQRLLGNSDDISFAKQMFARAIGWTIVGIFLSIAPGVAMRSFKKILLGLVGGLVGGLLGGLLFDPIVSWTDSDMISRMVGIVGIGVIAALATACIENAAKTGWLKVIAGLIAGKQFILYRNPTFIGSAPTCEIYLFKDTQIAPRHAALRILSGGYEIEDLSSGHPTFVNGRAITRARLRNGDQIQIGSTQFAFQEKNKDRS